MSGDERDDGERPRLSWREIDQRRDRARSGAAAPREPRGEKAKERAQAATQRYLKQLDDAMFGKAKGKPGSTQGRLAQAVLDARGTSELPTACRAYLEAQGLPDDLVLLAAFLDTRDPELIRAALTHLLGRAEQGGLEASAGLRSQLRLLADDPDDEIAETAEAILDAL